MAQYWLKYGTNVLHMNGYAIGKNNSPYNPLGLPPFTVRVRLNSARPTSDFERRGATVTIVDSNLHIYDITYTSTDWSGFFESYSFLVEVVGANLSGVTNMSEMFYGVGSSLESVCLFDTRSAVNMSDMFASNTLIESYPDFPTPNAVNMSYMFNGNHSLLAAPALDCHNVTDMSGMFQECWELRAVPSMNVSSAVNMSNMFNGAYKVESGALALYQAASATQQVTSHSRTFSNCGRDAAQGAAIHGEMYQIPTSWGGKAPEYGSATIGDKTYTTLKMPDGKEWMVENLDYAFEGAGDTKYYNDDETTYGWNGLKYGKLYTGRAAISLNQNRATLCPGWHVPSRAEYVALGTALGGTWNAAESLCPDVGTALKSTTEWTYAPGTDLYRFAAKPAGYYYTNSATPWGGLGTATRFWTNTMRTGSSVYQNAAVLSGNENLTNADALQIASYDKSYEYCSIRLVKDSQ